MSRNEEKHAGRLNRLWLQRLDEENAAKNPTRPGLGSLHTAEQVKKWMPSIKKDIDFYLKQSQVGCYPEGTIAEFSEKIESLTREYKAYLRKYRNLGGERDITPWSDQPYSRKHKISQDESLECDKQPSKKSTSNSRCADKPEQNSFVPIPLPIMDNDDSNKDIYTYSIVNIETPAVIDVNIQGNNLPLQFNWNKHKAIEYHDDRCKRECTDFTDEKEFAHRLCETACLNNSDKCSECKECSSDCQKNICKCCIENKCQLLNNNDCRNSLSDMPGNNTTGIPKYYTFKQQKNSCDTSLDGHVVNKVNLEESKHLSENRSTIKQVGNILNLPYSDSSSDEDS